jgi:hypothetical protein
MHTHTHTRTHIPEESLILWRLRAAPCVTSPSPALPALPSPSPALPSSCPPLAVPSASASISPLPLSNPSRVQSNLSQQSVSGLV